MPKAPLDMDPQTGLYPVGSGSIQADWNYLDDYDVMMVTYIANHGETKTTWCLRIFEWVDFQ